MEEGHGLKGTRSHEDKVTEVVNSLTNGEKETGWRRAHKRRKL